MRFRLSNGLSLGYRTSGAGRVLILLHPIGTGARFWGAAMERLQTQYRCIAIDLRGYGDSDTPPARFSLDDLADDAIELLRAQGIQGAVVVGCSMGGMVAQGMLLKAPELFAAMVLTGTLHAQTPERRHIPLQRALDCRSGMPPVVDETLMRWFPPRFAADHPDVIGRVRQWLLELDPVVFSWSWEAIADLNYGERLRDITVPSLLIRGTEDAAGRSMPEMAALLPRGRFVEMAGAGHMAPIEQPDQLAILLSDFLQSTLAGPIPQHGSTVGG
jgi:3-oxoadipate enol-lactonase